MLYRTGLQWWKGGEGCGNAKSFPLRSYDAPSCKVQSGAHGHVKYKMIGSTKNGSNGPAQTTICNQWRRGAAAFLSFRRRMSPVGRVECLGMSGFAKTRERKSRTESI